MTRVAVFESGYSIILRKTDHVPSGSKVYEVDSTKAPEVDYGAWARNQARLKAKADKWTQTSLSN